jgi:hypothetical protein
MYKKLPPAGSEKESDDTEKDRKNEPIIIGFFKIAGNPLEINFAESEPK